MRFEGAVFFRIYFLIAAASFTAGMSFTLECAVAQDVPPSSCLLRQTTFLSSVILKPFRPEVL